MAYWLGHEIFHAGGFVVDGGAWGVMGPKRAGKTTLLAQLAQLGVAIVADDQLIVETGAGFVMAGPRALDLRADAAVRFGVPGRPVRGGERHRLDLGPVTPETELRGWIMLEAGSGHSLEKVSPSDRPRLLSSSRTLLRWLPADPGAFVRLSALPVYRLCRPLTWEEGPTSASRLLDALT